jgi:hypothetical protein
VTAVMTALTFSFFAATSARAQVPQLINYQGRVVVGSTDFTGTGQFAFALVNANGSTTYWSNDGTSSAGSQPTSAVSIAVSKGLYSVLLGDSSVTHMTAVPATVFLNSDVRLRVWFNDGTHGFQKLAPDQRIAAVGYAMVAGSVASGGVSSTQLAANLSFTGNVTLSNGDLLLPPTTDGTAGVIDLGGTSFLHAFGTQNTFVGSGAGNFTMSGGYNVAEGSTALASNTTGRENAALGVVALTSNTTGSYNTAIGYEALTDNTTGTYNTATGFDSLSVNSSGAANTADGIQTLFFNSTGSYNTAVGDSALYNNTTGSNNSALGDLALFNNTAGTGNTALGEYALYALNGIEPDTGQNVAVGLGAIEALTLGNNNTALGTGAGENATQGSNNTFIGEGAGICLKTGIENIFLGSFAGGYNNPGTLTVDGLMVLGNEQSITKTVIAGIVGVPVTGAAMYINDSGQVGILGSSRRFKQNIQNMGDSSQVLLSLHPVTFQYKPEIDPTAEPQFGLVAEEVAKLDPDLVIKDKQGKPLTVRYEAVNAMLLNEFLKEHAEVNQQRETISQQQKEIEELKEEMAEIRRQEQNRTVRH